MDPHAVNDLWRDRDLHPILQVLGMPFITSVAAASANARASSPVFHCICQKGRGGALMMFCISGLMPAVGTGRSLARTPSGAAASSA